MDLKSLLVLTEELEEILTMKHHDYSGGNKDDVLVNFRKSERVGVDAYLGIIIRMSDKWERLISLVRFKQVEAVNKTMEPQMKANVNESMEDTLMDLAGYALLCIAAIRDKNLQMIKKNYGAQDE